MHVLLLTQVLPFPPDSGPKVKTWNVIKYLSRHHTVTLVSFVRGDQAEDVVRLADRCSGGVHTVPIKREAIRDAQALIKSLATGAPWMMVRDGREEMFDLVGRLAAEQRFDVIHADQLNMAQYAEHAAQKSSTRPRVILDAHNALWLLYKRLAGTMRPGPRKWLLARDWRLLRTYEGRVVRDFDGVLAVSVEDQRALIEVAGCDREMTIIPIAVDIDEIPVVERLPGARKLVHIGTMYWPPNIDGMLWFVNEIYPLVRRAAPDSGLDVIGARPPQELASLEDRVPGLRVTGYVPDVGPYLAQCGVFIVPLRAGGGMRVKILEALSRGLPVVATTLACEGIAVRHGEHVLMADTPAEFASAVLRVLDEPDLAAALSRNGRRLVELTYDYRAACSPLEKLYGAAEDA